MSVEFTKNPLSECIELIIDYRGKTPKKLGGDWAEEGYRALSAKNVKTTGLVQENIISRVDKEIYKKWMKEEVNRGDILLTSEAPLGQLMLWNSDEKIVLSQRLFAIRSNKYLDSTYLYYYMTSDKYQHELESRSTGTTVTGIKQSQLVHTVVEYPKIFTQKRIAYILASLDEKIELNRKMNQTLEAMAQTLFKSWFVDFDPVHAKANADSNVGHGQIAKELGISREILDWFPDEFEESELGMTPKGWEVKKFGDIVTPKKGKSITKKTIIEGDVPVVAGGLTPAYYHNQFNVEAPVITISASGANAGFVNLYNTNIWASDCSYINSTNSDYVLTHYIYLRLKQSEITWMQQGAAQPHIYPSHLKRLDIVDAGTKIWDDFENLITPMFKKITINKTETQTLQKTRDALLPKLLSGELDVSELELDNVAH